tara:strand:- start:338 stop:478 length:141 start_codon:yes stop_codon:yes gene_type:complete
MKYIMLLPMLLACGDKDEADSAALEAEEAVEEQELENEDTSSETVE